MDFEKYERDARLHYAAFGETVAAILRAAIVEAGGFRLQQVRSRAKNPASLRKKLEDRSAERGVDLVAADGLEDEIKDLAGCRIVFYTNGDVAKLINSGVIGENFEILETKLHHPRRETEDAAELYISNHYLVRLGADRLKLPEYATFAGLRCEVQVQTILNHAWAEMAHDTIYKEPELDSFGTRALDAIKTRMAKIARRYLVPAGYEFGKVAADFERLIKGEALFKGEALQAIVDAPDNNERMLALGTFVDSVLPLYDDVRPEFHEILDTLRDAVFKSRETEPMSISTPYGDLPAKMPADITRTVAKTIGDFRYVDPDAALDTLLDLYAGAVTEDERKPIREAAERLAGHELEIWNRHGPVIQKMIVNTLARRTEDQQREALPLVATLLEAVLGTEVTGTTSTSGDVTFHRGKVLASADLTTIRRKATALLKELYGLAADDAERDMVVSALESATRPPMGSGYVPELVEDLMESVAEFIEFQVSVIGAMSWELRQPQERRVVRHTRIVRALAEDLVARPGVAELRERIEAAIAAFRATVDADAEYAIYKILVGFEVVYPPSWETDRFGYTEEQAYRREEVDRLVAEMTPENADTWHGRVVRYAGTRSDDLATFPMFSHFLLRAGELRPEIVLPWLRDIEPPLARFLPAMLLGLQKSILAEDAKGIVREWIAAGSWLGEIAWFERSTAPFNESTLSAVTAKAVEMDDRDAVITTMRVAGLRYAEHPGTLVTSVFMPALRHMKAHGDGRWLGRGFSEWFHAELIETLDEEQASETLSAIVRTPEIDDGAAHVVAAVTKRWHGLALGFFDERELIAASDDPPSGFRSFPYSIEDSMRDAFAAQAGELLVAARNWFDRNAGGFEYGGGRLVARTFPDLDDPFIDKLVAIVRHGNRDDVAFAVAILNAYEGSERIDPVAKAAIAALEPGDDILEEVARALGQSGVVMGEFGFVERLEGQLVRLRTWLEDGDARIRAFAEDHVRYLERAIVAETQRAEASKAARRLEWGEEVDEE
ncbi:hypothetical protein [Erythrobacter aureus]|uniref:hypothetical protein n=1 Tax=Erythrobacter aureus TaxID=2182384 RepID=UPI003A8F0E2B